MGKLAFFPAELVRTNELLVLLGDNYFAERTAYQVSCLVSITRTILNTELTCRRVKSSTGDNKVGFSCIALIVTSWFSGA